MTNTKQKNFNVNSSLDSLIERQKTWNEGSRKMSNQELYAVLAGCLSFVEDVRANSKFSDLEEELKKRNLKYTSSTSIPTRVVRCVFNTQERRLGSFAAVITIALRQSIESGNFVSWINKHGGIDKTRRSFTKQKKGNYSISELGEIAKNNLKKAKALAIIPKASLSNFTAASNSGFVVNISRITANGDCEVIATSTDSAAIRNALASWGSYIEREKITSGQEASIREGVDTLNAALAA